MALTMRKSVTILLIACFMIASFGGINVSGDENSSNEIGRYERFAGSGDLSSDHIEETAAGVRVEGPVFTNTLRVAEEYLDSEIGSAWSANKPFVIENGDAVVSDRSVEFSPLEVGSSAVFTMGSRDQVQFQERPMWVSAQQDEHGATITLDMDDGDTNGQEVFIAKQWLWERGIHRPTVLHEDGTELSAVPTPKRDGWLIDMHHFTYIEIQPRDLVVFSREDGVVAPHVGETRWYEEDSRLEIDVGYDCHSRLTGCSENSQDILVDKDWLDMRVNELALHSHPWMVLPYSGDDYYQVNLTSEQMPTTLVYELFNPENLNVRQFTAGSGKNIFGFQDPLFLTVISLSNGSINLETELPTDVYNHTASIGFNYTWLALMGITTPSSEIDGERVRSYATSGGIWYYSIPDATPMSHTLNVDTAGIFSLAGNTCQSTSDANSGAGWSRTWGDLEDGLGSRVTLTALAGTFCWDWHMTDHPDRENSILWYTIWGEVIDAENSDIGCKTPSASEKELVVNDEGAAVCEWPEGESINQIIPAFTGTLVEASEYEERYSGKGSWDDCYAGGETEFGWLVPVIIAVVGAKIYCDIKWTERKFHYVFNNENRAIHRLAVGCFEGDDDGCIPEEVDASSYISVTINDGNSRRADTWDAVEDLGVYNDQYRAGGQSLTWNVHHVRDAEGEYSADISIIKEVGDYDDSVLEAEAAGTTPHMSFRAHDVETDFERTINIDTVDWEVPEDVICAPAFKVEGLINSVTRYISLGRWDTSVPCLKDISIPLSSPDSPDGEMGSFEVFNHSLPDGSLVASSASFTEQDVLDWNGDVVRAMVSKVVDDQEFLDSLANLTLADDGELPLESSCKAPDSNYYAAFTTTSDGISTIDGNERTAMATEVREICFEPLIITEYVGDPD